MKTTNWRSQKELLILAVCVFFTSPTEATAARYVRAEISLDGKTLLKGSTGDNGRVDADGVWEYLKRIKFTPTEAFEALNVDPTAKQTQLVGDGPGVALSDCRITVSIAYGGSSRFRELTLTRVAKDAQRREWRLDSDEVDKWFAYRLISRREAANLRNPRKLKP